MQTQTSVARPCRLTQVGNRWSQGVQTNTDGVHVESSCVRLMQVEAGGVRVCRLTQVGQVETVVREEDQREAFVSVFSPMFQYF
jgi:hypothetical protein